MKIGILQLNFLVGDFEYNSGKIIDALKTLPPDIDLAAGTELALSGYYPWDLMARDAFWKGQDAALKNLIEASKAISFPIAIGMVRKNNEVVGKPFFNSMSVIYKGEQVFTYDKKLLPTYNIFDEKRHFQEGQKSGIWLSPKGVKVGFLICEDGWNDEAYDYPDNPVHDLAKMQPDVFISLNGSPSNLGKQKQRERIFGNIAQKYSTPFVYTNQVGGNDEIVFDGASFAFDALGAKIAQAPAFEESVQIFNIGGTNLISSLPSCNEEIVLQQISLGLRDYVGKCGLKKIVVGSSGGIDSAVTLAVAALAIGKENVAGITMPSDWSSEGSVGDSYALAKNLDIQMEQFPIGEILGVLEKQFTASFNEDTKRLTRENLQARIRGLTLMAWSNNFGRLVLSTGNKSEISTGYCTLYGDTNGGLNLIGDLYKMEVYALARYINSKYGELIPQSIIDKEPSAELSPGQFDRDSLPAYPLLDAFLKITLEGDLLEPEEIQQCEILASQLPESEKLRVLKMLDGAEFKRKQAPPIIRIHARSFGNGRKIPVAQRLKNN